MNLQKHLNLLDWTVIGVMIALSWMDVPRLGYLELMIGAIWLTGFACELNEVPGKQRALVPSLALFKR